jgi:hypothetical protein
LGGERSAADAQVLCKIINILSVVIKKHKLKKGFSQHRVVVLVFEGDIKNGPLNIFTVKSACGGAGREIIHFPPSKI